MTLPIEARQSWLPRPYACPSSTYPLRRKTAFLPMVIKLTCLLYPPHTLISCFKPAPGILPSFFVIRPAAFFDNWPGGRDARLRSTKQCAIAFKFTEFPEPRRRAMRHKYLFVVSLVVRANNIQSLRCKSSSSAVTERPHPSHRDRLTLFRVQHYFFCFRSQSPWQIMIVTKTVNVRT